ncbi:MAG: NFACT family protein [Synergistales bacterium]|nr:NFACT family protein [Synergistales bacterium]MDY6402218.1 NFACT family protein [Synergistales bacterium]MDY6404166.1 NFACT family protein [Synergistales bacterium]MDY6409786.1 NFACT family protein [Synergistales bacterium]MDY6414203.1 NFACT family protein [Synergistales bacterium]
MAFGPEFISGLAGALKKILPLRVNRIEGGESWVALKFSSEQWILLSWASGAAGVCPASQNEINALKEISPSKASISEALKSRLLHGGEIVSVKQINSDRILEFEARRRISAGVSVSYFLVLEITEPVANFLLLDENHKIDEAAKHSTPDVNSFRTILPGHVYTAPPAFNGIELKATNSLKFEDVQNIKGIGRPLARLIQSHWEERGNISWLSALLGVSGEDVPCQLIKKNNYLTRLDFNFPETISLGNDILKASRHGVLIPLLRKGREKVLHSIDAKLKRAVKSKERHRDGLLKQLKECHEAEIFRRKGEAILTHIYEIPKRAENIKLTDWEGQELDINLDPNLTPSRNAEKYFKRYRKAKGNPEEIQANLDAINFAVKELKEQSALLDAIDDPENFNEAVKDLNEWITPKDDKKLKQHKKKQAEIPPHLNIMKDDVNILVGLSARGNRHVTFKMARPDDIWLHAHEMPGAHVIIKGATREELENSKREILEYAAGLAAGHSSGKGAGSVPIDYTERKYIRSVPGTVALVTYTNPGTLRVTPMNAE